MSDPLAIHEQALLRGLVRASPGQVRQFTYGRPIALVADLIYEEALSRSIDPAFAVAESILESGWGRSPLAQRHHNWYGFDARYEDPGRFRSFPSDQVGIATALDYMSRVCFEPGGVHYRHGLGCTLSGWAEIWVNGPPVHWGAAVRQLIVLIGALMKVPEGSLH